MAIYLNKDTWLMIWWDSKLIKISWLVQKFLLFMALDIEEMLETLEKFMVAE